MGKEDNYKYLVALYTHDFRERFTFSVFFSCKSVFGQFTTRSSSFHSYSATSCEDDNVKVKEKSVCVMLLKDVGVFLFYFFTFKSFSGSIFDM